MSEVPNKETAAVPQRRVVGDFPVGFAVELRFRVHPHVDDVDLTALLRTLALKPDSTSYHLRIIGPGKRGLMLTGYNEGDLFVFARRVINKIYEIGELINEEPEEATRPAQQARPDVKSAWVFEPPADTTMVKDEDAAPRGA
jgi:hypothetical protein